MARSRNLSVWSTKHAGHTASKLPCSQPLLIKQLSDCILVPQGKKTTVAVCAPARSDHSPRGVRDIPASAQAAFQVWQGDPYPLHSACRMAPRMRAGKGWHAFCALSPESLWHGAAPGRPFAALRGSLPGWLLSITVTVFYF